MTPLRHPLCFFCLFCVLVEPVLAQQDALLWKFKQGDAHHYRMTQDMTMSMTMGDDSKQTTNSVLQIMDMTWKVNSVDEQGNAKISQQVERVQLSIKAAGEQEMQLDTGSDEQPSGFAAMSAPLYQAMVAEPFELTMSPRGKVSDLHVSEAVKKAIQSLPNAAMMGDMFSDEGFQDMIQQSSLVLPTIEEIPLGFEWSTEAKFKNPHFGELISQTTYRYDGTREVEGKSLEAFHVIMELEFGDSVDGASIDFSKQSATGEILFDRELGCLHSSHLQQEMQITISAIGQIMVQQLKQSTSLQRQEKQSEAGP